MAGFFHMLTFRPLVAGSAAGEHGCVTVVETPPRPATKIHRAWFVAAVAFVATVGAAGFRATPGVLITPLQQEVGWSRGTISAAASGTLALFGLTSPFAAPLPDRTRLRP